MLYLCLMRQQERWELPVLQSKYVMNLSFQIFKKTLRRVDFLPSIWVIFEYKCLYCSNASQHKPSFLNLMMMMKMRKRIQRFAALTL